MMAESYWPSRLQGKVAVITGATGGIGAGIAQRLASEGAAVVVSGRRTVEGRAVVDAIQSDGGQAIFVATDVTKEHDCERLIETTVEHFRRVDILVNNAGIFPVVPLQDLSSELWDRVFAVNVRGPFLCCQQAVPHMQVQGGGSIINIGSTLAYRASSERLAYACSKGALLTLTKTLARGLIHDRIRVNWMTVGWVVTPGEIELRERLHGDGLAYLEGQADQAPLGSLETAEDIAAGVAYLSSDEAGHISGCELNISGGLWI